MLEEVAIPYQEFTFIDFGSGKGRALLLAAEFPFQRIVGVEFSRELVQIAARNIRTYRSETQRCQQIELVCTDAAAYPIPDEPAVLYFYNPFEEQVMVPVIENIRRSLEHRSRDVVVVYATPHCDHLWKRVGALRKIKSGGGYSIYATERIGRVYGSGGAGCS
jgi:tRNA1(Val) A37 N6-methylase TrmN6